MILVKVLVISILSFLLTLFLPWYTVAIVAFLAGLILSNKPGNNFLAGFLGVGVFWFLYAFILDFRNNHILSSRVAQLFAENLKLGIRGSVLLLVTTLLGGFIGGLSCMAGAMIMDDGSRKRLRKAVKSGRYTLKMK